MKKILFLLLITTASYSQALFDKGVKITGGITTDNTATKVVVQSANNVLNTISKTELQDAFYFATASALPVVGITDKLYITRDDNKLYRFNGTIYVPLNAGITSTATTNFIPKVNAAGNLDNSIISQPVSDRIDVNGNILISDATKFLMFGGNTVLFPALVKNAASNSIVATTATGSAFVDFGYLRGNSSLGFRTASNGVFSFINITGNPLTSGTVDTGISRLGAGRFAFGTGAVGNTSGQIIAAKGLFNTSTDDGVNTGIFNGTVTFSPAVNANQGVTKAQLDASTANTMLLTTDQTATGRKSYTSNNTTLGGITVNNSRTIGGGEAYGLAINSSGARGLNIDASAGVGARFYAGTTSTEALVVTKSEATTGIFLSDLASTDTGDFIKVNGANTGGLFTFLNRFGVASANAGTANNNLATVGQIKSSQGWANYADTQYTVSSPFSVASNSTVTLPNNAGTTINTYIPTGVTSFYNSATSKITPNTLGDSYTINVRFSAKSSMNNDFLEVGIDIGNPTTVIAETKPFLKGANTEQKFNFVFPVFSLATFLANGGLVKVTSGSGTLSVYNITYFITRTYKSL
jgi:hypothetical protein